MKILLTGTTNYSNIRRISLIINRLKLKYGDKLKIISGEDTVGAEKIIKNICKWTLDVKYIQYIPIYKQWTIDCEGNGLPKSVFGKEYNPKYIHWRNSKMVEDCEFIIFFSHNHTFGNKISLKKISDKKNKKLLFIN